MLSANHHFVASPETRKVVIAGAAGSGKSALVQRALHGTFSTEYQQTFGADLIVKPSPQGKQPTLHLWCCAGHERYRALLEQFFVNAQMAVLCFDLTSASSFEELTFWYNEVKRVCPEAAVLLVGTKADEADSFAVTVEDAENQAKEWGVEFRAVSCKTGSNVNDLFEHIHGLA